MIFYKNITTLYFQSNLYIVKLHISKICIKIFNTSKYFSGTFGGLFLFTINKHLHFIWICVRMLRSMKWKSAWVNHGCILNANKNFLCENQHFLQQNTVLLCQCFHCFDNCIKRETTLVKSIRKYTYLFSRQPLQGFEPKHIIFCSSVNCHLIVEGTFLFLVAFAKSGV